MCLATKNVSCKLQLNYKHNGKYTNMNFGIQCYQIKNHYSAPIGFTNKATAVYFTTIILSSTV